MLGDNLDKLVDAVFSEWMRGVSGEVEDEMLMAVARRLAFSEGEDGGEHESRPITRRLSKTVKRLNELHYQARWEAGAQGPRIIFAHCPYKAVIEAHPELCRMDARLLAIRLGMPVRQTARLERSPRGAPFCAFLLSGS